MRYDDFGACEILPNLLSRQCASASKGGKSFAATHAIMNTRRHRRFGRHIILCPFRRGIERLL